MQRFLAVVLAGAAALASVPFVSAQYNEYHYRYSSGSTDVAASLGMQRLWIDHAVWMRQYVISSTVGSPDAQASLDRLQRNHREIGEALAVRYGTGAAVSFTALLHEHLSLVTQRLQAAGSGRQAEFLAADERWVENAEALAAALHAMDPAALPEDRLLSLFHDEMELLTRTSIAYLQNDWASDVNVSDALLDNAVAIADLLSGATTSVGSSSSLSSPPETSSSSSMSSLSSSYPSIFDPDYSSSSSASGVSSSSGLFSPGSSSASSSRPSSGLFGPGSSSASSVSSSRMSIFDPNYSSSSSYSQPGGMY